MVGNRYRYTAREWDEETGLYYYRARYYDPTPGRFISEDPIGFGGGINFYPYAQNNSVLYNDPIGLWKNTGKPANPSANTIVCNGQGGIGVHIADYYELIPDLFRCVGDCIRRHEESHIRDALAANPKVCRGVAAGIQVGFSNDIEQDTSEIAAYTTEVQCLKEKKTREKCPTCIKALDEQIQNAEHLIERFRFFLTVDSNRAGRH